MSEAKHTPGPWKIFTDSTGYLSIEPIDVYIDHGSPDITEEDRANARLIVAAPALRQTCEYCHNLLCNGVGQATHAIALLEAALAQAEKKE